jgi:hypothetical protein
MDPAAKISTFAKEENGKCGRGVFLVEHYMS